MHATVPRFDPPDTEMSAPFWSALRREAISLPLCTTCGRWQWYPEEAGTDCPDGTLEWVDVAASGTVYSHSRVHRSFLPGGRDQSPYVVGMVDLDGVDGPRLVATLDCDETWVVGDRVVATFPVLGDRNHLVFAREAAS